MILVAKQHFSPIGWHLTFHRGQVAEMPDAQAEALLAIAPQTFERVYTPVDSAVQHASAQAVTPSYLGRHRIA